MIKFIQLSPEEPKQLTFNDVKENQFFVDHAERLCQKCDGHSYVVIANNEGKPFCDHHDGVQKSALISRIIPFIEKIEF